MKRKRIILLSVIIVLLVILSLISIILLKKQDFHRLGDFTGTPSSSYEELVFTPSTTFMVVCTPPVCAIGAGENYYCSGNCPGGCGTTCATYTPTP